LLLLQEKKSNDIHATARKMLALWSNKRCSSMTDLIRIAVFAIHLLQLAAEIISQEYAVERIENDEYQPSPNIIRKCLD
jgi:hypothetical protein